VKNKKKLKLGDTPSTIISFRYASIALIIVLILMFLIPVILNYGPETINTPFDIQMSYISYTMQFLILTCIIIIGIVALTKVLLKDIDDWYKSPDKYKYANPKKVIKVRKKCFNLPYLFYMFEVTVPSLSAFIVLSITGSHSPIMIAKIVLLLLSFTILLAIVSFIFSKDLYDEILEKTYIEGSDIGYRVPLRKRIFIIIFPIFLSAIILTGLAGYSASVIEKEDVLFEAYTRLLSDNFDKNKAYEMLKRLNINPSQKLKTLSKGTKEKVQLILVMSRNADLYLLDEPIGGVDPAARDYILQTILTNYNEQGSILISTHLISDVEQVLDQVIFLKNGMVSLQSSVDSIREQYKKSVDELFREVFQC